MAKLTTKFIQNVICPPDKRMKTYYDELGLLFRIMRATQTKSWLFQYRWEGKTAQISIGPYPQISLAEARSERDRLSKIHQSGINPRTTKVLEKAKAIDSQQHTIKALYELATKERINSPIKPWSDTHALSISHIWKHLKPIYNIPIANLTKAKLREILVKISMDIGNSTGQKAKNLMSIIYSYAELNDYVPKNLIRDFAKDPVLRKPSSDTVNKHPFIPLENLGVTYYHIRTSKASECMKAFLMIGTYTGLRVGSYVDLKWKDYDEAKQLFIIPKENIKNRRAINCPIPSQAKELLARVKEIQKSLKGSKWNPDMYIFSDKGDKHLSDQSGRVTFQRILERNKLPKSVLHGFRTVTQLLWDKQNFINNAVNVQLDHTQVGSSSVIDRYLGEESFIDERREMIQWLADYIDSEITSYQASL